MDNLWIEIMNAVASQGIWAILFVGALVYFVRVYQPRQEKANKRILDEYRASTTRFMDANREALTTITNHNHEDVARLAKAVETSSLANIAHSRACLIRTLMADNEMSRQDATNEAERMMPTERG